MRRINFRILGPLDVRSNGGPLSIGGPKQRALLAILLLSANRAVSRDRLIEELWGDHGSAAAEKTLNVSIARLRTALGSDGAAEQRLITQPPGYLLRIEPGELDLDEFERLVSAGREALAADDLDAASSLLREAEALWRGRPLADLEFEPFARLDVERLEELRLATVEDRIEAELALRRHGLVPELEGLIAAHPLRERLRAQLMRALYADARQADALAVYTDTRRLLLDELGIEPSEELRELEHKILNQDATLRPRPPARVGPPPSIAAPRRRRGQAIAAVALASAAAVFAIVLLSGGGTPRPVAAATVHPPAVAFLDASSGRPLGQVPGDEPGIIRFGAGSIWAMQQVGVLLQINPRTLGLTRAIPLGNVGGGSDFAIGNDAVWVTVHSRAVLRIDPRYGSVSRVPLPSRDLTQPEAPGGVATGAGSVWVAQGLSRVVRVDPVTGRVQHRFDVPGANVVAFGGGAAWVSSTEDVGRVTKIDPRTNTITATTRLGTGVPCLVVGGGYVWAGDNGRLWKLSFAGDVLRTFDEPGGCGGMSFAAGGLWLAGGDGPTAVVQRIDAQSDRARRYRTGHLLTGLGASPGTIAVSMLPTAGDLLTGVKGRVLRISFASSWPNLTDPAVAGIPGENRVGDAALEEQLQDATCARLLRPRHQQLVPEIATAPPQVSNDGRTFRFQISRRYRFSPPSNAVVTPAAFKYSIERALSPRLGPNPPGLKLVPDIVGLDAYRTGAATHISGITATGATLAIRLTRAAPDFPERITASYFCPAPVGTPLGAASGGRGGLDQPIPSAGPFYLSGSLGGAVLVLRRNPGYGGRRPRHLDAIVYRTDYRLEDAVGHVVSGKADYVAERGAPLAGDGAIARRFGRGAPAARRFSLTPLLGVDELVFNPRSRLLADSAMRHAVSLALDRPALAGVLGDVTTDRYLPPGMRAAGDDRPAYGRGTPDVRVARRLAGGTHGRVRLAVCGEPACLQIGRIVRANLQQIGIAVQLRRYDGNVSLRVRRSGADITLARVLATAPEPAAFLRQALGAAAPHKRLNELALMARPRRIAAATKLELQLLHGPAPAVAFGNPAIPEFFSGRVGCRTSSPVSFGTDLAALCLKR